MRLYSMLETISPAMPAQTPIGARHIPGMKVMMPKNTAMTERELGTSWCMIILGCGLKSRAVKVLHL